MRTDGQTHDEANGRLSNFANVPKNTSVDTAWVNSHSAVIPVDHIMYLTGQKLQV